MSPNHPATRPAAARDGAGRGASKQSRDNLWVNDRASTLLLVAMTWVMLLSLSVPWNIFTPVIERDSYAVNPLARIIKLALLALGIIICAWRARLFVVLLRDLNPFLVAFLVLAPLSILWSISPGDTIARCISLACVLSVCTAFCLASWNPHRLQRIVRPFLTFMLLGSIVFVMISPELAIEQGEGTLKNAWRGLAGQKNIFGQMASIGTILWFHGWLARELKAWQALIFGGVAAACVFLSRSSTSLLATVFACCFLLLLLRSPRNWRRFMPYIVAVFGGIVLTYALTVLNLVPGLSVLLEPVMMMTGKDMTFSNRSVIWEIIKEHVVLSPYIGSGYGAYWIGPVPTSASYTFLSRMYFYPTESHNGYLEIVNDLGALGLFVLFGYLIVYIRQSLQVLRIDRNQGALYLALFFQQAIMNLSESCWLDINSPALFAIMTLATLSIARALLQHRFLTYYPGPAARA